MDEVFDVVRSREGEVGIDGLGRQKVTGESRVVGEQVAEEKPTVGMLFKEIEEVYKFYKAYAKSKGFGITRRGLKKDAVTREYRWMTITCTKNREHKAKGRNLLSQRPSARTGCKARVCCAKKEELWMITKVQLEHNHEVSPSLSRYIRQHRQVNLHYKRQLEVNDMAGLRPCENVKAVVYQAGGHEELGCLSVDLINHVNKVRKLQLNGGDAEAIHQLFGKQQTESRDFVYVIKPDKEGRLKHVFWADGRCRAAYQEFCDVITFDTTYLVNKYDMPFGTFVGVNQHGQSILLGCALINNEKAKTYKWLFETWLSCMDGKHPDAIITDQCAAIGDAIKTVFPNTRHRLCLWHILCKLPMKLSGNCEYKYLKEAFMDVVYDPLSVEEFEVQWRSMIYRFHLEANEWLASLFEIRQWWVPVYVKSFFWAGMSSTQRSESMHSFFDGYVHSRTSLCQFVNQYSLAVADKVEKERQEDFLSLNSQIPCVTRFKFEVQLRNVYTNNIFKHVQKEITDVMYCDLKLVAEEGGKKMFDVLEMKQSGSERNKWVTYHVSFDKDNQIFSCICKLFEFKGILCAHVFKVLVSNDVSVIPERYLARRWRKDIPRCHSTKKINGSNVTLASRRTKELEVAFYSSVEKVVKDERKFQHLLNVLNEQNHLLDNWKEGGPTIEGQHVGVKTIADAKHYEIGDHGLTIRYKDPALVRRRGRPKSKRKLSAIEAQTCRRSIKRREAPLRKLVTMHPINGSSATELLQQANEGRLDQQRSPSFQSWAANSSINAIQSGEVADEGGTSAHVLSRNYVQSNHYGLANNIPPNAPRSVAGTYLHYPQMPLHGWQVRWHPM